MKKLLILVLMIFTTLSLTLSTYAYDLPSNEWEYENVIDTSHGTDFKGIISKNLPSERIVVFPDIDGFMLLTHTIAQQDRIGIYTLFSRLTIGGQLMAEDNYYKYVITSYRDDLNGYYLISGYIEISFEPYNIEPSLVSFRPFEVEIKRDITTKEVIDIDKFVYTNNYILFQDLFILNQSDEMYFKQGYTRVTNTLNLTYEELYNAITYYPMERKQVLKDMQTSLNNAFDDGYQQGFNEGVNGGGISALLVSMFTGIGALLSVELLPNISIGAIVSVPLLFGVVFFILGRRKDE